MIGTTDLKSKSDLRLRKARPEDSEFAFHVKKSAFKEYVEQINGWDEAVQKQLHTERFVSQDFRIISYRGTDAGIVAFEIQPDYLKLNQLFLLPGYQCRGIGEMCMKFIMDKARSLNLPVRLRILKVNPKAMAFYKRIGFQFINETDTHVMMEKV